MTTIVWYRSDLRITDNPALSYAAKNAHTIIPVYIYSPDDEAPWAPGGASRVWLHHSLNSLDTSLQAKGSRLIIRRGAAGPVLDQLIKETGADTVVWNRRYEPHIIDRDAEIKASLKAAGLEAKSFNSTLLFQPWEIKNKSGNPFLVFTPFYRHCLKLESPRAPSTAPRHLPPPETWPDSEPLDLLPEIPWDTGIQESWTIGEDGATEALEQLLDQRLETYSEGRDRPGQIGTSRLSPYLHFGQISPHQIWEAVTEHAAAEDTATTHAASEDYLREIIWREYAYHLLFHFSHTPTKPLKEQYADFPWNERTGHYDAWCRGQTGYPMVDAGMRELWHTGWMHNRVRMIVASFLIKHLLIPWQKGAAWFWDTLVDADLASNTMGWQWTAGCGADAAPFFRIFNPTSQGTKFDGKGAYVRTWCPELAHLPDKWIYDPSNAPAEVLQQAGVVLGETYPEPIVDHKEARTKALNALEAIKMT